MISKLMVTGTREITPSIEHILKFALGWATYVNPDTLDGTETPDILLLQGGAKGVDLTAKKYWNEWGYSDKEFPADWNKHGKSAGGIRNQEMVDARPEMCLAFPSETSKGTWDAVRRAKTAEILTFVLTDQDSMYKLYYYTILKPGELLV